MWQKSDEEFTVDPNKYTDLVITEAIKALPKALEKGSARDGLIALVLAVDQLENICKARNLITDDDKEYKEAFEKAKKQIKEKDLWVKQAKLANVKLRLLLERIFATRTIEPELPLQ